MHYKDGTEARIGDHVVGVGYNLKNPDGTPRKIAGTVIALQPGQATCNISVCHTGVAFADQAHQALGRPAVQVLGEWRGGRLDPSGVRYAYADCEYGQCDQFELVSRAP